jgi:hypothetical protein
LNRVACRRGEQRELRKLRCGADAEERIVIARAPVLFEDVPDGQRRREIAHGINACLQGTHAGEGTATGSTRVHIREEEVHVFTWFEHELAHAHQAATIG